MTFGADLKMDGKLKCRFVPPTEMYKDEDGGILMGERKVVNRWRQHYNEHLNTAYSWESRRRKRTTLWQPTMEMF